MDRRGRRSLQGKIKICLNLRRLTARVKQTNHTILVGTGVPDSPKKKSNNVRYSHRTKRSYVIFDLAPFCNSVYKPGSVLNGHLSSLYVTVKLRGLPRATYGAYVGQTLRAVLLRIRFTANLRYRRSGWALTPPFHPYLHSNE